MSYATTESRLVTQYLSVQVQHCTLVLAQNLGFVIIGHAQVTLPDFMFVPMFLVVRLREGYEGNKSLSSPDSTGKSHRNVRSVRTLADRKMMVRTVQRTQKNCPLPTKLPTNHQRTTNE